MTVVCLLFLYISVRRICLVYFFYVNNKDKDGDVKVCLKECGRGYDFVMLTFKI